MIYTVTFNPAIDYVIHLKDPLVAGATNRTVSEEIYFGGKGINVSVILNELGMETTALGFTAGFTGKAIREGVAASGIHSEFITLPEGNSRINVKIKGNEETEINAQGPAIPMKCVDQLFTRLDEIKEGDMLVISGSIPSSLPDDIYERILEHLSGRSIDFVVDASGDLLLKVLKYHPFLIKPNRQELEEMLHISIRGDEDIAAGARCLQQMGARNVLVSMAGDGSLLVSEKGDVLRQGVCRGKVLNSVGAGDSMVAGFIAGYKKSHDYRTALDLATAAGGATVFSAGLGKKERILQLYHSLRRLQ